MNQKNGILLYGCGTAALYMLWWFFLPQLPVTSVLINTLLAFLMKAGLENTQRIRIFHTEYPLMKSVPGCLVQAALAAALVLSAELLIDGPQLWKFIPPGISKTSDVYGSIPLFLIMQLSAACAEESLYRFFLLKPAAEKAGPVPAILFVSFLFSAVHWPAAHSLFQVTVSFFFSLFLAGKVLYSGKADAGLLYFRCVLIHFAYNILIFWLR